MWSGSEIRHYSDRRKAGKDFAEWNKNFFPCREFPPIQGLISRNALNIAVVPKGATMRWLTAGDTGSPEPHASTLNDDTGIITSNSAVVPAGTNGSNNVFVTDATDVVIDINGYYTTTPAGPQGPPGPQGVQGQQGHKALRDQPDRRERPAFPDRQRSTSLIASVPSAVGTAYFAGLGLNYQNVPITNRGVSAANRLLIRAGKIRGHR
jgi:hypothetical protein